MLCIFGLYTEAWKLTTNRLELQSTFLPCFSSCYKKCILQGDVTQDNIQQQLATQQLKKVQCKRLVELKIVHKLKTWFHNHFCIDVHKHAVSKCINISGKYCYVASCCWKFFPIYHLEWLYWIWIFELTTSGQRYKGYRSCQCWEILFQKYRFSFPEPQRIPTYLLLNCFFLHW